MLHTLYRLARRTPWMRVSQGIDWFNHKVGWIGAVAVMGSCLLSTYNVIVSTLAALGLIASNSNTWSEFNSYLFAACVLLGAAYVLRVNEHVRVDVIYSRLTGRQQVWVDLFGLVVFLMPVMVLMTWLSWPYFLNAYQSGELLGNSEHLKRWPLLLMMPVGFGLLVLQGISEVIKRVAWLNNLIELDLHYERPLQ